MTGLEKNRGQPMWSKPEYIDWDKDNTQHIEAADLTPEEVESVLDNPDEDPDSSEGAPDGTERWIVFGTTDTGKHIAMVFEILCDDPFYVHPVTAYYYSAKSNRIDPPAIAKVCSPLWFTEGRA